MPRRKIQPAPPPPKPRGRRKRGARDVDDVGPGAGARPEGVLLPPDEPDIDALILASRIPCDGPSKLTDTPLELLNDPDALWVRMSGWTPLEYLTFCYRNPYQKPSDRIAAAKAVMEHAHRAVREIRVSGNPAAPLLAGVAVTPKTLSSLSDDDLAAFTALLEKLKGVA